MSTVAPRKNNAVAATPKARLIGRILRLLFGIALTAEAVRHLLDARLYVSFEVLGVVVALAVFYALVHLGIARFVPRINPWFGALVAVTPVILVFIVGGPLGQLGTLLFIGVSLVLTAFRADGGCEVMTIPGMFLGRRTHLVCIAFSPIDLLEDWVIRRFSAADAPTAES